MNSPSKQFYRSAAEIRTLVPGRGACIATDHIMVEGRRVGWMYREEPNTAVDSGWRFLSGLESDEYMDREENMDFYDVNTVANYDPDILPFLDAPVGSAFQRDEEGREFVSVVAPDENVLFPPRAGAEGLNPRYPAIDGPQPLPGGWTIYLPRLFSRRQEGERWVFWRPGVTAWVGITPMENPRFPNDKLARMKQIVPPGALAMEEIPDGRLARLAFRLVQAARLDGNPRPTHVLHSFVFSESGYADLEIFMDDESDIASARTMWLGMDHAQPV